MAFDRRLWWAAIAATALALVGCGGGGADRTKAQLRFVNASSGYAALDLREDDSRRFAGVGYGAGEEYREIDPDADLDITRPDSSTALLALQPELREDRYYTLLAYGSEGALQSLLLEDRTDEPDAGKVRLRVVNAAPDAGSLDLYLSAAGESLTSAVALHAGVAAGKASDFALVNSGAWQLRATAAGDKTDLRLDLTGVDLPSRGVMTLVLTPTTGGVLVHALQLRQRGAITRLDNTQARVRAAAPNDQLVNVLMDGVALMTDVRAPAVGAYRLVRAGTQSVTVKVNGVPLDVGSVALAPGTDQTLLIYRDTGFSGARWLADDNRLASAAGQARVRLVHGRDSTPGALALKVDLQPVGDAVTLPGSSTYGLVAANAAARVSLTAAGSSDALYDAADIAIVAGGVYSVFAVAGKPPLAGFVRRDR